MATKYRRHQSRCHRARRCDEQDIGDAYPEPPSLVVWIVLGMAIAVLVGAAIKDVLIPLLDFLKGLL